MQVKDDVRLYKGRSMEGTFRPGDLLHVTPVPLSQVRAGDVVIYRGLNQKGAEYELVHRVIHSLPDGLVVRGDRNRANDRVLVNEDNLVGKVVFAERMGKKLHVRGRRLGLMRARVFRGWLNLRRLIWGLVRRIGRTSYRRFRSSGIVFLLWHPLVQKVRFVNENGPLVKYLYGNRTVATHWVDKGLHSYRRPYDLLLGFGKFKKQEQVSSSSDVSPP
jgi:hypothetical protein